MLIQKKKQFYCSTFVMPNTLEVFLSKCNMIVLFLKQGHQRKYLSHKPQLQVGINKPFYDKKHYYFALTFYILKLRGDGSH